MDRHEYFDLLLHSDAELNSMLGEQITGRMTLHEWPLSCVQRIALADGRTVIYKAESEPTVEPEFYAQARSPLLVQARTLFRDDRYACLLLEDLPVPRLSDQQMPEAEVLNLGRSLLTQIAAIEGGPPVYLDVSTWEKWQAVMAEMIEGLHGLVASGEYQQCDAVAIRVIERTAQAEEVQAIFARDRDPVSSGLVHGDFRGDNLFRLEDSYRLIDWQRPFAGPAEIDFVHMLDSQGIDPRPHVAPGIMIMERLLLVHWVVACSLRWFLPGIPTYDRVVAQIAARV